MDTLTRQNALIYARRSQKQHNAASVTDQVTGGREACEENGWDLADVIDQDDDRSASRFARKDRPGWERLLAALRAGAAQVIVLWESSRGDRKLSEWAGFLDECRERDVRIHVVSHDRTYDLSKPRDWRVLADDGVDSAFESEKNSVRIRRGRASAIRRGEPHPVPPDGYRAIYDQDTGERTGWVIVPDRAEIVREVNARICAHEPVRAIARDFDARGIRPRRGAQWNTKQIRHMAMNPAYAALLILENGTIIEGNWPPIITRAQWNDAMTVLDPRKKKNPRPASQRHLLTYLGTCVNCKGAPLTAKPTHSGGALRYSCRKGCFYIPCEWLDDLVTDVICERLSRPDARDLFKSDDTRSEQLRNELAELRAQLDEWAAAAVSPRAYQIKEAQLLPQIEGKGRELDALTVPPALAGILSAADVRAEWKGYTVQARRAIIAAVTGVEVCRGPAPDWMPAEFVLGKIWIGFTWEPAGT